jgi:hypothetical protein
MSVPFFNAPHSVIPAKAGISCGTGVTYHREIPAFAGMTIEAGVLA